MPRGVGDLLGDYGVDCACLSLIRQKIPHFWGTPSAQTLGTGGPPKMGDFLTNQTLTDSYTVLND